MDWSQQTEILMDELFAVYNLIFYLPIATGLLMIAGMAMGVVGHELELDHDVDAGQDGDHGVEHDHDSSITHRLFAMLGIGRVPISVVFMLLCLLFGGIGVMSNLVLKPLLVTPWLYAWISLGVASIGSIVLTGRVAALVYRYMPSTETEIVTERQLVGRSGVLTLMTDVRSGLMQLRDARGHLQQVSCRTEKDELPKGSEVLITEYDADLRVYVVVASPLI